MDSKTRDLMLSAWHENRLAAVHIDLQNMYYLDHVFKSVGQFAGGLRNFNIPNIWVTFPNLGVEGAPVKTKLEPCITTVGHFNAMAAPCSDHNPVSMISTDVAAKCDETVIVKNWGSAFRMYMESHLHNHLEENNIDTILVTGVKWDGCVTTTFIDGVMMDKYNVIAVQDCIDIPEDIDYKDAIFSIAPDYLLRRNKHTPDSPELAEDLAKCISAFHQRFHTASSNSIFPTLASIQPKAFEPIPPAVLNKKYEIIL